MTESASTPQLIWVIDTSSIIQVRRLSVPPETRQFIFDRLTRLVTEARLLFPIQVFKELERSAHPNEPDEQFSWAERNHDTATGRIVTLDQVRAVLEVVPDVLDVDKDSGEEEADPYVLALARSLRSNGVDARIVAEEIRDTPAKISMNTAAGVLGIPSVPLRGLLRAEDILTI